MRSSGRRRSKWKNSRSDHVRRKEYRPTSWVSGSWPLYSTLIQYMFVFTTTIYSIRRSWFPGRLGFRSGLWECTDQRRIRHVPLHAAGVVWTYLHEHSCWHYDHFVRAALGNLRFRDDFHRQGVVDRCTDVGWELCSVFVMRVEQYVNLHIVIECNSSTKSCLIKKKWN